MRKASLFLPAIFACCLLATAYCFSQVQTTAINATGAAGNSSAALDVSSSAKGILIPRLTTAQRNAIVSPANGLLIYNLDCSELTYFNGSTWVPFGNVGSVSAPVVITGNSTPCQNATGEVYSIAAVSGATGYNWSVSQGASVVSGQGTTSIIVNFGTINGSICVTANNQCGSSNATCLPITLLAGAPSAPTQGTHVIGSTQVIWNWNSVSGATGYKWNTINDYNTAIDMGANTSKTQTGLSCETPYKVYVWAYNSCGHSGSTVLSATTAACCACQVSGFPYREPVSISNSTGSTLTDYQVMLNVTYNAHMKSDFSDLRFRDSSCANLSYWVESYIASTSAVVWVKVPKINTYGATIYMYYGNAGASTASNGPNTFCLFEDFESGNLNNWSTIVTGTVSYGVTTTDKHSGSYSNFSGPSTCHINCWYANKVDYTWNSISLPSGNYYVSYWRREPVDWGGTTDVFVNAIKLFSDCGGCNSWGDVPWYKYGYGFNSASAITAFMVEQQDLTDVESVYFDDIIIRKYVAILPEPTPTIGTEESCP